MSFVPTGSFGLKDYSCFYVTEHRQKPSYAKIICKLIIAEISNRRAIAVFRFVGAEKFAINCTEKELKKTNEMILKNNYNILIVYL